MVTTAILAIQMIVRHINFTAKNGMNARFLGRFIKLNGPKHIAMVRNGHGIHAALAHRIHQAIDAAKAIQQTVLCMHMEVCKSHDSSSLLHDLCF